jgi:hypothetical protein
VRCSLSALQSVEGSGAEYAAMQSRKATVEKLVQNSDLIRLVVVVMTTMIYKTSNIWNEFICEVVWMLMQEIIGEVDKTRKS